MTELPTIIRPLSAQQERVVALLCRGLSNPSIAKAMGLSVSTVKGHILAIDNLFVGPRDPEVSRRERIRLWGLWTEWDQSNRTRPIGATAEAVNG